jgi:hypothetical protein
MLESHNYRLAASSALLHSLWKGARIDFVKKDIPAEVEMLKKGQKAFFEIWKIAECGPTRITWRAEIQAKVHTESNNKKNLKVKKALQKN